MTYRLLDLPERMGYRLAEVEPAHQEDLLLEAYRHIERKLGLERIREIMGRPHHQLYAALDAQGDWVGMVWLAEGEGSYGLPAGFIYLVAVKKQYRGRGLGHWLMEVADWWARQQSYRSLELNVDGANLPARRLYASHGYTEVRVRMRKVLTGW